MRRQLKNGQTKIKKLFPNMICIQVKKICMIKVVYFVEMVLIEYLKNKKIDGFIKIQYRFRKKKIIGLKMDLCI